MSEYYTEEGKQERVYCANCNKEVSILSDIKLDDNKKSYVCTSCGYRGITGFTPVNVKEILQGTNKNNMKRRKFRNGKNIKSKGKVKTCYRFSVEEINFLKLFLEVTRKDGIYGLLSACDNRDFAFLPLMTLIEKIVKNA
ncbi:hypothetical protein NE686_17825 [Tissierella carlieri]|uniref:Uncharacterized protein n=1 Tax=Tissierella carlieri TaxID=689904 RepID=A0ABT1SEQ9_9FIRM|nr:hypothetical protein [Tissierella carlieri]MCQ4924964.1 hypothetical protein [Tissierella carlieri]